MNTKILIVEDEETLAKAVRKYLQEKGEYIVDWAPDGEAAIDKLEDADVILLDIVMPKTDGLNLLNNIRKNPNLKNKKVIMLTNLDRDIDKETANELGVFKYLVKSDSTLEEICAVVKQISNEPEPQDAMI